MALQEWVKWDFVPCQWHVYCYLNEQINNFFEESIELNNTIMYFLFSAGKLRKGRCWAVMICFDFASSLGS